MIKATIIGLAIKKRLLHLALSSEHWHGTGRIEQVYHKHEQAELKSKLNIIMHLPEDTIVNRVGHVFSWEWLDGKLYPVSYIGHEEIIVTRPLVVDANSPTLRANIPQSWFTVEQLWKRRGGGDVQFYTHDGRLVAIEHKTITDLLSSLGEQETSGRKMTRQIRHILEADIAYLVIEGRNWKRDVEGLIETTQDYKQWHLTGWRTSSVDGFIRDWQEAGVRVVWTENISHTVEFITYTYHYWQRRKHAYLDKLLRKEKP